MRPFSKHMLEAAHNIKTFETVKQINVWPNSAVRHNVNNSVFNIRYPNSSPPPKINPGQNTPNWNKMKKPVMLENVQLRIILT